MIMDYEIFTAPYGVCMTCHWETEYSLSDEQIVQAMRDHYRAEHGYDDEDERDPGRDNEN